MTDTQPGAESAGDKTDWNRQASTYDWEGWIAEENAADAERAKAAAEAAVVAPSPSPFPVPVPPANYLPPMAYPAPGAYPPPGYGPPGMGYPGVPTSRPRDVVSVLALIFGILPFVPVGFVLGIIGIVRTANPVRKGRWMAVTGLVLSMAWVAATVALPLYLNNHDAQRDAASGQVTKATTITPRTLRAGDCYNDTALSNRTTSGVTHVTSLKVIPCSQPHNAVVYAVTTLPAGTWTSVQDKVTTANEQCLPLAKQYFNGHMLNPNLRLGAFAPSQTEWEFGYRSSHCIAVDPDKSFTGDIRADR